MAQLPLDPTKALRSVMRVLLSMLADHEDEEVSKQHLDLQLNLNELRLKVAITDLVSSHLKRCAVEHLAATTETDSGVPWPGNASDGSDSDMTDTCEGLQDETGWNMDDDDDSPLEEEADCSEPEEPDGSAAEEEEEDGEYVPGRDESDKRQRTNLELERRRRAVEYWRSGIKKKYSLTTVQKRFTYVNDVRQLYAWEKQIQKGGSWLHKLRLIELAVLKKYNEHTAQSTNVIPCSDYKKWALAANQEVKLEHFVASQGWVKVFKRKHNIGAEEKDLKKLLNQAVLVKYKARVKEGKTVCDKDIQNWALQANLVIGVPNFYAKMGWVQYFKERNHIAFRKVKRQSKKNPPVPESGEINPNVSSGSAAAIVEETDEDPVVAATPTTRLRPRKEKPSDSTS